MDNRLAGLRIAFVTPTYGRSAFVSRTIRYVRSQQLAGAEARWFIDDDTPAPDPVLSGMVGEWVDYSWRDGKIALGAKRNALNDRARAWGADFICAMDDDDWYGPAYGFELVTLLLQAPQYDFAGSGNDHYYHVESGRILHVEAARPTTTCNCVLAYRASVLDQCRYDPDATSGEEPAFFGKREVLQLADVRRVHMALAHRQNTTTKRNYVGNPAYRSNLTLLDFPMTDDDREFYRRLTETAGRQARG